MDDETKNSILMPLKEQLVKIELEVGTAEFEVIVTFPDEEYEWDTTGWTKVKRNASR